MKVIMTRRADGSVKAGRYVARHWAAGIPCGEDEILEEREFDIPDAYETDTGPAWDGGHITDHPSVRAWIKRRQ